MTDFTGFDGALLQFFDELKHNNNRDWFAVNKDRFRRDVQAPIIAFIEAFAPRLEAISPHFIADPRPNGGSMFRIYRDTRFSKDKRPYKEHAAVHFRHQKTKDVHAPGYYLHLAPDEVIAAAGVWMPPSEALASIRARIDRKQAEWVAVRDDRTIQKMFGGIWGDGLTRPPKGYDKDHPHIEDLKRKSFFCVRNFEPSEIGKARFIDAVEQSYRGAAPLMRFLTAAVGADY